MIDKTTEKKLAEMVGETGIKIQLDTKRLSPVKYGFLRASIYHDYKGAVRVDTRGIKPSPRQVTIPMKFSETTKSGLNSYVGSDLDYAYRIEPHLEAVHAIQSERFNRAVTNLAREAARQ